MNCLYLLLNIVILFLAWFGLYTLTSTNLVEHWLISWLEQESFVRVIKLGISISGTIIPGIPVLAMMTGFLRGKIKIYRLLVALSMRFHEYDEDIECWKMLFKIIILKILGKREFRLKLALPTYVELHTAGAILAREGWISVYFAPVKIWTKLSPFVGKYISEVKKLPASNKKRYIISERVDIIDSITNLVNKRIFIDALNSGAKTYVVFSDSNNFQQIKRNIRDFSAFDKLVMVYSSPEGADKLKKVIEDLEGRNLAPEEEIKKLRKTKIECTIAINTAYPNLTPEFNRILNAVIQLDSLSCNVRKKLNTDCTLA